MKIYQTNGGLGYQQLAYLLRLDKSENGYNYLCIGRRFVDGSNDDYIVGEVVEDLEEIYIEDTDYKIEDSPLYGSFLFDFFVKNIKM